MTKRKGNTHYATTSDGYVTPNAKLFWNPGNPNLHWGFEGLAGMNGKRYLHYPAMNFYTNEDGTVRAFGQESIPIISKHGKNYIEIMAPSGKEYSSWHTGNNGMYTVQNYARIPIGETMEYVAPPVLQPKPEQTEESQKTIEEDAKPVTIKPKPKTTPIKQPVPSSALETLSKNYTNIIKPHTNEDPAYTPVSVWSLASDGHYRKIIKLKNGKFRLQDYKCDWADDGTVIVDENPIEDIISDNILESRYSWLYSPEFMWKSPYQPLEKTTLKSEQNINIEDYQKVSNLVHRGAGLVGSGVNKAKEYLEYDAKYDVKRLQENLRDAAKTIAEDLRRRYYEK